MTKYTLGILIGVIISIVGMGIYAYATSNPTDKVIVENTNLIAFERNFTVNALTNNQRFEINVTKEGLVTPDYLPVIMPIMTNQNEQDISIGRPFIDSENRSIFVWTMSNQAVVQRNITLVVIIFGE